MSAQAQQDAQSRKGQTAAAKVRFYLFNNVSRTFRELNDGSVAGRNGTDLSFPDDPLVSRRQCRFTVVGNEVYIEDFDSTNRTKVNSVTIRQGVKRRIRLNDVIEFGNQRLVLTHQERFAPPNTEDLTRRGKRSYRAARKDDGSLTRTFTGMVVDRTLVLIGLSEYRRLQLQKALRLVRRAPKSQVVGETTQVSRTRRRHRAARLFVWLTVFCGAAAAAAWNMPALH